MNQAPASVSTPPQNPLAALFDWLKRRADLAIGLALCGFTLLNTLPFYDRVLFSDNWRDFPSTIIFRPDLPWLSYPSRRPFENILGKALIQLFGIHLDGYYAVEILELMICACLVYAIARRLLPRQRLFCAAVAALTLAYPVDYTRMWISMLNTRLVLILALVFAWLWLDYARKPGRNWRMAAGVLLLIFTLGIHEAHLGLVGFWCVWLFYRERRQAGRWHWGLLAPLAILPFYFLWRTSGVAASGANDVYLSRITLDPWYIFVRLVYSFTTPFIAWTEPLRVWTGIEWGYALWIGAYLAGTLLLLFLGVMILRRVYPPQNEPEVRPRIEGRGWIRRMAWALLLFMAGLFPILFLYFPRLDPISSRGMAPALPGLSLLLVLLLWPLVELAPIKNQARGLLFGLLLLPYLAIGTGVNLSVQRDAAQNWALQKAVFREITRRIENINPACSVAFFAPDLSQPEGLPTWQRRPLYASWETTMALRILYNQPDLVGNLFFVNADGSLAHFTDFRTDREVDPNLEKWVIDENNTIVLEYRYREGTELEVISENIPGNCVLSAKGDTGTWRFIIN